MSFCLMGLVHWGQNRLIKYESAPCFSDWKLNFVETGFIKICDCDSSCEVQKVAIAMYGIGMDVVKIMREEFDSTITMESIFSRSNTLDFMSRFTTRVALDSFFVKCDVPRVYYFDNTKKKMALEYFKDHILSKSEALEPKRFKAVNKTGTDPFVSSDSQPNSNQ